MNAILFPEIRLGILSTKRINTPRSVIFVRNGRIVTFIEEKLK